MWNSGRMYRRKGRRWRRKRRKNVRRERVKIVCGTHGEWIGGGKRGGGGEGRGILGGTWGISVESRENGMEEVKDEC